MSKGVNKVIPDIKSIDNRLAYLLAQLNNLHAELKEESKVTEERFETISQRITEIENSGGAEAHKVQAEAMSKLWDGKNPYMGINIKNPICCFNCENYNGKKCSLTSKEIAYKDSYHDIECNKFYNKYGEIICQKA